MKKLIINRIYQPGYTIGVVNFGDNTCFSLELPWKDNQEDVSCIPPGTYLAQYRNSPSNGDVLELQNVPLRTFVQVHSANFTRQLLGCIAVGDSIRDIDGDSKPDVTNSKNTLDKILDWAGKDTILIEIKGEV